MVVETFLSGALGAFIAAWAGAYLGFRRTKKERALDRRIAWHDEAIQSLAQYEDRLEHLERHARHVLVIQAQQNRPQNAPPPKPEDLPRTVKAPAPLWDELGTAEGRARAALRIADLYTEGRTRIDCSVALNNTVNMVLSQWIDIGPDPQIPWLELRTKALAVADLRRTIQESYIVILELSGFWASIRGPQYRQRRALREIEKLRTELAKVLPNPHLQQPGA